LRHEATPNLRAIFAQEEASVNRKEQPPDHLRQLCFPVCLL